MTSALFILRYRRCCVELHSHWLLRIDSVTRYVACLIGVTIDACLYSPKRGATADCMRCFIGSVIEIYLCDD